MPTTKRQSSKPAQGTPSQPVPGRRGPEASLSDNPDVKTTIVLPEPLWRAVKIRAVEEHTDFRRIVIAALGVYLGRER